MSLWFHDTKNHQLISVQPVTDILALFLAIVMFIILNKLHINQTLSLSLSVGTCFSIFIGGRMLLLHDLKKAQSD
jgi:hypothetical protein